MLSAVRNPHLLDNSDFSCQRSRRNIWQLGCVLRIWLPLRHSRSLAFPFSQNQSKARFPKCFQEDAAHISVDGRLTQWCSRAYFYYFTLCLCLSTADLTNVNYHTKLLRYTTDKDKDLFWFTLWRSQSKFVTGVDGRTNSSSYQPGSEENQEKAVAHNPFQRAHSTRSHFLHSIVPINTLWGQSLDTWILGRHQSKPYLHPKSSCYVSGVKH